MTSRRVQTGFTLVEILTVLAIAAVVMGLAVPAVSRMVRGGREAAARNLVRTALTQARAYAAKEQKYAGVRFQQRITSASEQGRQYLVLIEHVGNNDYEAVPNAKAKALPKGWD